MPTENTGNTTMTDGTEQTLATITTPNTYVLALDLSALANGDTLEVRIYTKQRAGGTSRQAYMASYSNVPANPNAFSVPVPTIAEFKATMKLTAGSNRAIIWSVYQL